MIKKRSLNRVFISLVLAIYIITAVFGTLLFFNTSSQISGKYLRRFIKTQNELEVNSLLAFMEKEIMISQMLAEDPQIIKWMDDEKNSELQNRAEEQLNSYKDFIKDGTIFLAVANSQNYYLDKLSEPANVIKKEDVEDAWFFRMLNSKKGYELNVNFETALNEVRLWINVKVRNTSGEIIGITGAGIYIDKYLQEVVSHEEKNIDTILISENGVIEGHKDRSIVNKNGKTDYDKDKIKIYDMLSNESEKAALKEAIAAIKNTDKTKLLELTYNGERYEASVGFIPELKWYNMVLVQKDSVMGWTDFLPLIVLFLGSALIILVMIILVFTNMITNPLKKLTKASEEVASGRYDIKIDIEKENEIGLLARSFNSMTTQIQKYTSNLEELVSERTKELQVTNNSLRRAQEKIVSSLEYARLLQSSILPTAEELNDNLSDHFVIYEPLDIVGGDFYFFKRVEEDFWIAGVDCTGHGVPGAFMTMMTNVLLHQVIDATPESTPGEILPRLHGLVKEALKSKTKYDHLDNGLDIALCKVSMNDKKITYAGAGLPFIYLENGEVQQIKGDSLHIGYDIKKEYIFEEHRIAIQPDSVFYLITDGILDLPGGQKGYGLGRKELMKILQSVSNKGLADQKKAILKKLEAYRGEYLRRDDMLMIGFKMDKNGR